METDTVVFQTASYVTRAGICVFIISCGIYTDLCRRSVFYSTLVRTVGYSIFLGGVFSEFGRVHIYRFFKLYKKRLSNLNRCGSCLDIVVTCGLLKECSCRERSFTLSHTDQRMGHLAKEQTGEDAFIFINTVSKLRQSGSEKKASYNVWTNPWWGNWC